MAIWKYKCMRCGRIYNIQEDESGKTYERTLMGLCPEHEEVAEITHKIRNTLRKREGTANAKKKKKDENDKKVDKLVRIFTKLNN